MAVERYGSKTDLVVKLILVFCVSMLSFAIGTLVGKKFSDNQHRIGQLDPSTKEKTEMGEEVASEGVPVQARAEKSKGGEGVTDKEISKLAEEFVDDEKPTRKVAAVEGSDSEEKSSDAMDAERSDKNDSSESKAENKKAVHAKPETAMKVSLKKVTEKSVADATPTADKTAVDLSKESKEVKTTAAGKFTVQVASYAKEEEAEGMTSDLKNKGFSAFYVTAQVKGQKWFRVSVGLFSTMKEAQAYRSDLLARAKVSSAIVQKIN